MHALPLVLALLFAAPVGSSECETKLAIALALHAEDGEPAQVSVVKDHVAQPRKKVEQAYKEVRVTKYRYVKERYGCKGGQCKFRWVKQPYTVVERVPVTSRTGGYPTTPKQTPWTQGGKKITWQHLTTGVHAGKYDAGWLQTLTDAEIQQLHADDHEGTVKKNFIVRPQ